MKQIFPVTLLALALAACTTELDDETVPTVDEKYVDVIIHAEQISEDGTKTAREANKTVSWLPSDEINIICGTQKAKFVSTNTERASIAAFSGQLLISTVVGATEGSENNSFIWGLYPYDENVESDGTYVTTTLPHTQTGVSGTFADDLFMTLARSQSFNLGFYSVCSGFKFTLANRNIRSISFAGNNNEDIAGKVRLTFADGVPAAQILEGQKSITLTPEGGVFETGEDYYFVFLPTLFSKGFTVTFTDNQGNTGAFEYTRSVNFARNNFVNKSLVDKDVIIGTKNLSEGGTANSYIVSQKGSYKFEATKGNGFDSVGDIKGVKVLWESFGTTTVPAVGELIKSDVSYADGYITFQTNDTFKEGNALIAAYSDAQCSDGNVLWSWHIWLTDAPSEHVYANNVGTMMDRNLGATSATPGTIGTTGLMYQWGRKDPFMGSGTQPASSTLASSTLSWPPYVTSNATYGTMEYATKNPTTYIYNTGSPADWVYGGTTTRWKGTSADKTLYDPCPPGWHIPNLSVWTGAGFVDRKIVPYDSNNYGVTFGPSLCGADAWYPLSGAYVNRTSIGCLNYGLTWSATLSDNWDWVLCYYFYVDSSDNARAQWGTFEPYSLMPVRCCKEGEELGILKFSLDRTVMAVPVGSTTTLVATIKPDSEASASVSWTSSKESVATVSPDGTVTGIAEGEAIITATAGGKTATCSVLVGNYPDGNISFADNACKDICVNCWDKNGDGELSYVEAGFVKSICSEFIGSSIVSFDEFQYFVNCTALNPKKYKSDGDYYADGVFEGIRTLTSIILPSCLTTIGENCFSDCRALTAITIPASVNSLGYSCFSYCTSLDSITILAETPPSISFYDTYYEVNQTDPKTFFEVPGTIRVPSASLSTYKSAIGWSRYSSKITSF